MKKIILISICLLPLGLMALSPETGDPRGLTVTSTLTVSPSANPEAICVGESVTLSANASGGGGPASYTFTWVADEVTFSSDSVTEATPSVTTIYTVTVNDGIQTASGTITVTVNPLPNEPSQPNNPTECEDDPIQTLTATASVPSGDTIIWYETQTGGNSVANPTWSTVGTKIYYAEAKTLATGCRSSSRTPVTLTINAAPAAPEGSDQTTCEQNPIQPLVAQATPPPGANVVWYDSPTGGNYVPNPSLNQVGNTTFYAESADNITNCRSFTRTPVVLTINPAPSPPTVTNASQTSCEQNPIQPLVPQATPPPGAIVEWFDSPTGGNYVPNPSLNQVGNTTFYAESKNITTLCRSLTRVAVNLTMHPAPAPPISGGDQEECEISGNQTLTATATVPSGIEIFWYSQPIGGNTVNPVLSQPGTETYWAEAISQDNCSSLSRTQVTLTIHSAPATPISGGDQTECATIPIQTLTATASSAGETQVVWYNAETGGSIVENPVLNSIGSITYYAEARTISTDCPSLQRTSVTLTINPLPQVNAGPNQSTPYNGSVTFTNATAIGGSGNLTYSWTPADKLVDPDILKATTKQLTTSTFFTLEATDENGCKQSSSVLVTVTGGPLSVSATANPTSICKGSFSVLNAIPNGGSGNYTYNWTSIPPGFTSELQNVIVSPESTTFYSVQVTDGISAPETGNVTVVVNQLPTVNAGTDKTIEYGSNITLNEALASGAQPLTYEWTPADKLENHTVMIPTTVLLYQSVNFTMKVTDGNGCVNTDVVRINITGGPLNVTAGANPSRFCLGQSTELSSNPTGGSGDYTYTWSSVPPDLTSNVQNPVFQPDSIGEYTITVDVAAGGQNKKASFKIMVDPLPDISCPQYEAVCEGSSPFDFTNLDGDVQYNNETITSFTPEFAGLYSFVLTKTNEVGCSNSCNFTITVKSLPQLSIVGPDNACANSISEYTLTDYTGEYDLVINNGEQLFFDQGRLLVKWGNNSGAAGKITLKASADDCETEIEKIVILEGEAIDPPKIVSKPIVNPVVLICNMYGHNTDGTTYQWYKNNVEIPGETQQFYYPGRPLNASDKYYAMITHNGCSVKSEESDLKIMEVDDDKLSLFSIYPNPAGNEFFVILHPDLYRQGDLFPVSVNDLSGRQLIIGQVSAEQDVVSVSGLPDGMYLVSLFANGAQYFQRLIILKK